MENLHLLLGATAKTAGLDVFAHTFRLHSSISPVEAFQQLGSQVAPLFQLEEGQGILLINAVRAAISTVLFRNLREGAEIVAALPEGLNQKLKELIATVIVQNFAGWRSALGSELIGVPRLIDFDWRADIKTSSDLLSRMAVPTAIVELKIQPSPTRTTEVPEPQSVVFETSRETLNAMLDGMRKIKEQLTSVHVS